MSSFQTSGMVADEVVHQLLAGRGLEVDDLHATRAEVVLAAHERLVLAHARPAGCRTAGWRRCTCRRATASCTSWRAGRPTRAAGRRPRARRSRRGGWASPAAPAGCARRRAPCRRRPARRRWARRPRRGRCAPARWRPPGTARRWRAGRPWSGPPIRLEVGAGVGHVAARDGERRDDREVRQRQQQLRRHARRQPGRIRSRSPSENTPAKMSAPATPRQMRQRPKMTSAMHTQPRPAMMSRVKLPSTASVRKAPPTAISAPPIMSAR